MHAYNPRIQEPEKGRIVHLRSAWFMRAYLKNSNRSTNQPINQANKQTNKQHILEDRT